MASGHFSVLAEDEGADEEIKQLVFVDFVVWLLTVYHRTSKQTFQLTGFVKY